MGIGCGNPKCAGSDPAMVARYEAFVARERAAGEPWVAAHRKLQVPPEHIASMPDFLASLEPQTQRVAQRFPLESIIRSRPGVAHLMPPPGMHARVSGYRYLVDKRTAMLIVDLGPDSPGVAIVDPDEVELVECVGGITPTVMGAPAH